MKSMLKTSVVTLALAGLALAGCNSPTPDNTAVAPDEAAVPSETAVFECPGGETITAEFDGTETAVVTLPNQEPVTLVATEAASGARYSDDTTTFWNKGDEALVEVNDEILLSECKVQN